MSGPVDAFLILCPPWANPDVPPLGIGYLSEYLEAHGLRTAAFDYNAELFRAAAGDDGRGAAVLGPVAGGRPPRDLWEYANAHLWYHDLYDALNRAFPWVRERLLDRLAAERPRVVGFSIYVENVVFSARLAAEVRRAVPATRIVFGGPLGFVRLAGNLLPPGTVDLFATGEGEELFRRIVAADADPRALANDPEIARLDDWAYRPFAMREPIASLDDVPFPRYARLDLTAYSPRAVQIIASRGCPHRCVFCNDRAVFGRGFRARSVAGVIEELRFHAARGIAEVGFNDLNLTADPRHARALCDAIVDAGLSLRWAANAGCRGLTRPLVRRMKKAGCDELFFGLETGSDRVMRGMRKASTVEEAERSIRLCHEEGVGVAVNLIAGFPTETEEDFAETLAFVERNRESISRASSLNTLHVVSPATLWNEPERFGVRIDRESPYPEARWRSDSGVDLGVRLGRLRRLIDLFERLGLPFKTTNYFGDRALFERYERAPVVLAGGPLRVEPGPRIWRVLWNGEALSADVGFFFDLLGDGVHFVSHRLDWRVERDGNAATARGEWPGLPLAATARIAVTDGVVAIHVEIEARAPFPVKRLKFGWIVVDAYDTWRVGTAQARFPEPTESAWRVVGPSDGSGPLPLAPGFRWTAERRIALSSATGDRAMVEVDGDAGALPIAPVVQTDCHPGRAAGYYSDSPFALEPGQRATFSLIAAIRDR